MGNDLYTPVFVHSFPLSCPDVWDPPVISSSTSPHRLSSSRPGVALASTAEGAMARLFYFLALFAKDFHK
jgi:hypothetical protein